MNINSKILALLELREDAKMLTSDKVIKAIDVVLEHARYLEKLEKKEEQEIATMLFDERANS